MIHRASLPECEVIVIGGIPATTVPRTLLDLSSAVDEQALRRLVREAEFRRFVETYELVAVLDRHPRRKGRGTLAGIVRERLLTEGFTRSVLEDRFLAFCSDRGLPLPETNVPLVVGGREIEVDCLWREQRVALELDSRRAHDTTASFESDRARDRSLMAANWRPVRITWAQLHRAGDSVEADLRVILGIEVDSDTDLVSKSTRVR